MHDSNGVQSQKGQRFDRQEPADAVSGPPQIHARQALCRCHRFRQPRQPQPRHPRPGGGADGRDAADVFRGRREAGLLPLDGISDGPAVIEQRHLARSAAGGGTSAQQAGSGLRAALQLRAGRRARQRRLGPAGGVFPRLPRHARIPGLRLRHPLRARHVPAGVRQRLANGTAGRLAQVRQPVGNHPP